MRTSDISLESRRHWMMTEFLPPNVMLTTDHMVKVRLIHTVVLHCTRRCHLHLPEHEIDESKANTKPSCLCPSYPRSFRPGPICLVSVKEDHLQLPPWHQCDLTLKASSHGRVIVSAGNPSKFGNGRVAHLTSPVVGVIAMSNVWAANNSINSGTVCLLLSRIGETESPFTLIWERLALHCWAE